MGHLRQRELLTRRQAVREPAPAHREAAPAKPTTGDPARQQILDLQRRLGNQAVLQLMREGKLPPHDGRVTPEPVQRTGQTKDGRLVSHADPSVDVGGDRGVISAVAAGSGVAHTIIYFEHKQKDLLVHLTTGGLGSSGSESKEGASEGTGMSGGVSSGSTGTATTSGQGLNIEIREATDEELDRLYSSRSKRAWARSTGELNAGLKKAHEMQDHIGDYVYKIAGTGLTFSKAKAINCARFGEEVLKAAGVKASSGLIFKTPAELATGKKKFFK